MNSGYPANNLEEEIMTNRSIWIVALVWVLCGMDAPPASGQERSLKEDAEAYILTAYEAWNKGDQDAIVERWPYGLPGFGFRSLTPRGMKAMSRQDAVEVVRRFFASMEYYRLTVDELHTVVHDDVVVAWGYHTEDFKVRGRDPEVVRVRFSVAIKKSPDGWHGLLGHRDIQRFDEQGRYIPIDSADSSGTTAPETEYSPTETANRFVGSWQLISVVGGTPELKAAFGPNPTGMIYYDDTGHMGAQIMTDRDRARWELGREPTPDEAKDALDGYAAYFGTYTIDEMEQTVTHHRTGNIRQGDLGDYIRHYEFVSDDKLILRPVESPYSTLALTWKRIR